MDCPVCLDSLNNNNNNKLKTLSCGHVYHYKCYMDIVNRGQNLFVVCPLCRNMNTNIKKPFNNPKDNIKILCNSLKNRCICKTKKGLRCKNKPRLLNYGMCHIHNKSYLTEEYYPLMEKFIYLTLIQRSSWYSKIYLIDIGKKIILNKLDINSDICDILNFYYEYYSIYNLKKGTDYHNDFYKYYELEKPPISWIEKCKDNYCLF